MYTQIVQCLFNFECFLIECVSSIEACKAGQYFDATEEKCENCPPGYVSETGSATSCIPCSNGTVANHMRSKCVCCPPNAIALSGGDECMQCPPQHIPNQDQTECKFDLYLQINHGLNPIISIVSNKKCKDLSNAIVHVACNVNEKHKAHLILLSSKDKMTLYNVCVYFFFNIPIVFVFNQCHAAA